MANPVVARSQQLPITRIDDDRVYVADPPTVVNTGIISGALRAAFFAGSAFKLCPQGDEAALAALAARLSAGLDPRFKPLIDEVSKGLPDHRFSPLFHADLAVRIVDQGVELMVGEEMVAAVPRLKEQLHCWIRLVFPVPPEWHHVLDALDRLLEQAVLPVRWIDEETWMETALPGVDVHLCEPAKTVEEGLGRLKRVPDAHTQSITEPGSRVSWIGWDNGMIRAVNREPLQTRVHKMMMEAGAVAERQVLQAKPREGRPPHKLGQRRLLSYLHRHNHGNIPTDKLLAAVVEAAKGENVTEQASVIAGQAVADVAAQFFSGKTAEEAVEEAQERLTPWLLLGNPPDPEQLQLARQDVAAMSSLSDVRAVTQMMDEIRQLQRQSIELQEEAARKAAQQEERMSELIAANEQAALKLSEVNQTNKRLVANLADAMKMEERRDAKLDEFMTEVRRTRGSPEVQPRKRKKSPHTQGVKQVIGNRVEFDPAHPEWSITCADLRRLFADHADAALQSDKKRAKLLTNIGVPRCRTKSERGWACLRAL